ncbi:MAG: molybdopterin-guanine dinucleotide biosynthesis protein B [Candidatus Thorarchaeota archaeon]|jgi:molybdopterin-guanine dinucleotide biosynthesis protein B
MRVFAVAGFSSTGKTELVEALIMELSKRGYSVSTIKSTNEEASDREGTDTARHQMAGAKATLLVGPESIMLRSERPTSLKEIISSMSSDLLIIEGMKEKRIPKIWCIGDGELPKPLPEGVVAIYAWKELPLAKKGQMISPYTLEKVSELADLIETVSVDLMEIDL